MLSVMSLQRPTIPQMLEEIDQLIRECRRLKNLDVSSDDETFETNRVIIRDKEERIKQLGSFLSEMEGDKSVPGAAEAAEAGNSAARQDPLVQGAAAAVPPQAAGASNRNPESPASSSGDDRQLPGSDRHGCTIPDHIRQAQIENRIATTRGGAPNNSPQNGSLEPSSGWSFESAAQDTPGQGSSANITSHEVLDMDMTLQTESVSNQKKIDDIMASNRRTMGMGSSCRPKETCHAGKTPCTKRSDPSKNLLLDLASNGVTTADAQAPKSHSVSSRSPKAGSSTEPKKQGQQGDRPQGSPVNGHSFDPLCDGPTNRQRDFVPRRGFPNHVARQRDSGRRGQGRSSNMDQNWRQSTPVSGYSPPPSIPGSSVRFSPQPPAEQNRDSICRFKPQPQLDESRLLRLIAERQQPLEESINRLSVKLDRQVGTISKQFEEVCERTEFKVAHMAISERESTLQEIKEKLRDMGPSHNPVVPPKGYAVAAPSHVTPPPCYSGRRDAPYRDNQAPNRMASQDHSGPHADTQGHVQKGGYSAEANNDVYESGDRIDLGSQPTALYVNVVAPPAAAKKPSSLLANALKKPEVFSKATNYRSVEMFINDYRYYIEALFPDEQRTWVTALYSYLDGRAKTWFADNIQPSTVYYSENVEEMFQFFRDSFNNPDPDLIASSFRNRKRKPGESTSDYLDDMERMLRTSKLDFTEKKEAVCNGLSVALATALRARPIQNWSALRAALMELDLTVNNDSQKPFLSQRGSSSNSMHVEAQPQSDMQPREVEIYQLEPTGWTDQECAEEQEEANLSVFQNGFAGQRRFTRGPMANRPGPRQFQNRAPNFPNGFNQSNRFAQRQGQFENNSGGQWRPSNQQSYTQSNPRPNYGQNGPDDTQLRYKGPFGQRGLIPRKTFSELRDGIFKEIEYLLVDRYYRYNRANTGNQQKPSDGKPGQPSNGQRQWPSKQSRNVKMNVIQGEVAAILDREGVEVDDIDDYCYLIMEEVDQYLSNDEE